MSDIKTELGSLKCIENQLDHICKKLNKIEKYLREDSLKRLNYDNEKITLNQAINELNEYM